LPTAEARCGWERIRARLAGFLGETQFAIWLEPLELIATDAHGVLVVAAPAATASWVQQRFGRLIAQCARHEGLAIRFADQTEGAAFRPDGPWRDGSTHTVEINKKEVS
jgi:chromosomal replication initiation ATPase DnaA